MALRLRPVDGGFFELLTEAARHLAMGTTILAEAFAADADREAVAARMREAERAADETTHALVRRLNASFVTPFDREDLYRLAESLDDVMDLMEGVVDMVQLYRVKRLPAELLDQVDVLQRCAELSVEAMPRLRSLRLLEDYWIQVNSLENTGDRNHRRILALLFSGEFKTFEVLKLKDIAENLEAAIDGFEDVANIVEQIAVKEG